MPGTALDRRVGIVTGSAAGIRRGTVIAPAEECRDHVGHRHDRVSDVRRLRSNHGGAHQPDQDGGDVTSRSCHPGERDSTGANSRRNGPVGDCGNPALEDYLRKSMPLGGTGTAEEVARAVARLCSAAASYITSVVVPTDGGQAPG